MSSGGSSSTAGSNAGGATAAANQPGQAADVGNRGSDGSGQAAATNGPEGNIVEKQPNGGGGGGASAGGGTHEPHASSPAHQHRHGGGQGGGTTTTSTSTVLRRKTNVCLICGIYTNLSLNIFEPRNGPNIVDVIYEKYKFRAERGDNADKHICFSCNNWLINWYSLQNTSSGSSRAYEPAPSTSRSSSAAAADSSNNSSRPGGRRQHAHKPRTKAPHRHVCPPPAGDKENRPQKRTVHQPDQHGQISSTTGSLEESWEGRPAAQQLHPYAKKLPTPCTARRGSLALKESNGQQVGGSGWWNQRSPRKHLSDAVVSSSTEEEGPDPYRILVKPFESRLIQMLQGQGTSVTKEQAAPNRAGPWVPPRTIDSANGNCVKMAPQRTAPDANGNDVRNDGLEDVDDSGREIVISFDTTLSEVIDVVPSLKAIHCWYGNEDAASSSSLESAARNDGDPVRTLRQRLSSGALTVSLVDGEAHRGCSSGGYV